MKIGDKICVKLFSTPISISLGSYILVVSHPHPWRRTSRPWVYSNDDELDCGHWVVEEEGFDDGTVTLTVLIKLQCIK